MLHSAKEDKADNNARMGVRPITEQDAPIGIHCLIEDTRAMNMDPVEIYANREFKLEVWEDMVKTMKVGEIARFSCPWEVRKCKRASVYKSVEHPSCRLQLRKDL